MTYPKIILVEPSHPGNIGAIARAMKTMGHTELRLVQPKAFPSDIANARASGAVDILHNATCYPDLISALQGCDLVFATSARPRTLNWKTYSPRDAARHSLQSSSKQPAIVFGRESSGLTNDELNLCQGQIIIPTIGDYHALNLSHAVQIMTYEFANLQETAASFDEKSLEPLPHHEQILKLHEHLAKTLKKLPNFTMTNSKHTLNRLNCFINRAQPTQNELNLLRGILSAIDSLIKQHEV